MKYSSPRLLLPFQNLSKMLRKNPSKILTLVILQLTSAISAQLQPSQTKTGEKVIIFCPPWGVLPICFCAESDNDDILYPTVTCKGSLVTHEDISLHLSEIRTVNNLAPTDLLTIARFRLHETLLPSLDLTIFLHTHIEMLDLQRNLLLSTITKPGSAQPGDVLLDTFYTNIGDFNEHSLVDLLSFTGGTMQKLDIRGSRMTGLEGGEFVEGLNYFKGTTLIIASNSDVRNIEGGQFRQLGQLRDLSLVMNDIRTLGEDALRFDNMTGIEGEVLNIILQGNSLTDEGISPNHGLDSIEIPTTVNLSINPFEFISAENFQSFLNKNPVNRLEFDGQSQFVCDARMKWLKDGRAEYENRVTGILCTNDPGRTIFTTNLV